MVLDSVKHGPRLSKTWPKLSKTQSNGRVDLINCQNPPGTLNYVCVLIPLGSPTAVSKWPYVHVPEVPRWWSSRACRGRGARYGTGWGIAGWVYRVGNTGVHRQARSSTRKVHNQRSGPRKSLAGAGVGGLWTVPAGPTLGRPPIPLPTPAGPGRSCGPPW